MKKENKQNKYYEQYFQIFTYFNNLWNKIVRKHTFKVNVQNQPKVQDVKITNPQEAQSSIKVSNLEQVEKALKENAINIIEFLEKKIEKPESVDNSDIIKGLKEIKDKIKIEKDLTPEVIKRLEGISKEIGGLDTKPDLSGLESHLEASYSLIESLKDYTEYDEWKVKINAKQMEELVNAMGKTMISASGTGIIKDGQGNPYSSSNKLPVEATLEVGDIEIGAVEIKDGTTDNRAVVDASGNVQAEVNNTVTVDCNSSDVTVDNFPATQTVDATNLDIRDLTSISDSVEVKQATATNLKAEVDVNDISKGTQTNNIKVEKGKESSASSNTKVSVGSTSTTVLAANANRRFAVIVNDSDEDIYLNLSGTAVINEGIRINANGGNYVEDIYTGIITGICASGSKNVTITEV